MVFFRDRLSPMLFSIFIDGLAGDMELVVSLLLFADDIVLVAYP